MTPARRRVLRRGAGLALVAVSVAGAIYAVRAGWSQHLYWRVKYGPERRDVDAVLRLGATAHRLYPHNYNLCMWIAEHAPSRSGSDLAGAYGLAEEWCDRGLSLNPYPRGLRFLKMCLLHRTSVADALAYWKEYVEWQFWEPYNHAVLVDLYVATGQLDEAERSLHWVKGSPHFKNAKQLLDAARRRP